MFLFYALKPPKKFGIFQNANLEGNFHFNYDVFYLYGK